MAGTGWDAAGIDASITISGDGQTATRTGGNNDTYCVRGVAGRYRGRRYFEITPGSTSFNSYVGAGFIDAAGSLGPHTLGSGSPIQGGWRAASGQFTYSYASGSGSRADGPDEAAGVLGVLIDFDNKTCEIYKDGTLKFTEVMDIPNDTTLFPACGLYDNGTEASLQTEEPFQYPPAETFIAWDIPDSALIATVSGILEINSQPVSRTLKAFSFERLTYDLNGEKITETQSLGQTVSDEVSGSYDIILRDSFPREVFVVAFDDYGSGFVPNATIAVGDRVHPTTPNGYVWECTGSGELPSEEPEWIIDTETSQLYGTASMIARIFYRPMVHGPIVPAISDPGTADPETIADVVAGASIAVWYDPSDLSTLYQDQEQQSQVTSDGQLVALVLDKSGNGIHGFAPDGRAPIYRTDGTRHWLEFDGTNDYLVMPGVTFAGEFTLSTAAQYANQDSQSILVGHGGLNNKLGCVSSTRDFFFRVIDDGPAVDVDVPDYSLADRVFTGIRNNQGTIVGRLNAVEVGSVLNQPGESNYNVLGGAEGGSGVTFLFRGRLYGFVAISDHTAEKTQIIEGELADKAGITLP